MNFLDLILDFFIIHFWQGPVYRHGKQLFDRFSVGFEHKFIPTTLSGLKREPCHRIELLLDQNPLCVFMDDQIVFLQSFYIRGDIDVVTIPIDEDLSFYGLSFCRLNNKTFRSLA